MSPIFATIRRSLIAFMAVSLCSVTAMATDLSEQVAGHLAAGEYQAATELANSAPESQQQSLLQQVAAVQLAAGDLQATQGTLRNLPMNRGRVEMASQRAQQEALNGTGADFDSLIELIQAQTTGPWEDIDGVGGTINEYETGVRVDPTGLLARLTRTEETNRLKELNVVSRQASINQDMAAVASLRMVSLTRLEKAVAERIAQGQPVVESMRNLAGLYQIQHVFVYPETGDIVIAGPASGWGYNHQGQPVSLHSEVPTLQLDDLVTVLRTFSEGGEGIFGCSINPRQEGLRDLKAYVESSQAKGPISSRAVRSWVNQLQRKLGLQDVEIYGVPAHSRVARVIVEADFRMKLLGIGKLDGGAEIPDYFELMSQEEVSNVSSLDALRWWLSLRCESVLKSDDATAFELNNSSVLCQSENQFVNADGERVQTGQAEETNRLFAANFTQNYEKLAQQDPVFADLQNVFDLALVAALIQNERLANQVNWDYGVFANGSAYFPTFYEAPATVDSVVNHKVFNGTNIVVQVAGGVRVDPRQLLTSLPTSPRLGNVADSAKAPELAEGRWWWDVNQK